MSHLDPFLILSSILVIAGFFIRLVIARNRFNRRGAGGLQHYSNYWRSLLMGILEWIFGKLAFAMILFGLFLMGIYVFNQCHAEKHRGYACKRDQSVVIDGLRILLESDLKKDACFV